ncbi:very short patch repair endonuclease [Rhodanobacter sp. IGA1.0]|uniref:Very short patch repair endonuclease n=1 Tax=Rhodanobacter sp. IGA1.0 TaxID=3158582 RepID=A0AAU7QJV4_9GAMM
MADFLTAAERSERMSRIRGQNTKPELLVRKFLHQQGFRYRLHVKELPGRPDLVLPKYGTTVFVDGCFWHGHSCQGGRVPATNTSFWKDKISTNQDRDRRNRRALRRGGWRVIHIWECQLSTKVKRDKALTRLASKIRAMPTSVAK